MVTPALQSFRQAIDAIDDKMLHLLQERGDLVQQIAKIKQQAKGAFHVPEREAHLLRRLIAKNKGPYPDRAIEVIFREILSASLALESTLKVAYLGPEGTFSHAAAAAKFGSSVLFLDRPSIRSIFEEVEAGRAHYGVVPVENSTEGVINITFDLFIVEFGLQISGELLLPIHHHLVAVTKDLKKIKKLYSHEQALAQCRQWIEQKLPQVKVISAPSTAQAALLAKKDKQAAAISSAFAAEKYKLKILHSNIEDVSQNFTRFWVIGQYAPQPSGHDKTSIMFVAKDEVGILAKVLQVFAEANINLTKIESRPSRQEAWEYVFFIDLDGHRKDSKVAAALEKMESLCHQLKILGSYPKGNP